MAKRGHTQVTSDGIRTRSGKTPGGRNYTAHLYPRKNGNPGGGHVSVKSATTTWNKNTLHGEAGKPQHSVKSRVIHEGHSVPGVTKTFNNVKGPTKPKQGFGKTHTFADGGKVRFGTTPGGRQYKATKYASGYATTKVGGLAKETRPATKYGPGGVKKVSVSTGRSVAKGQTKPKR